MSCSAWPSLVLHVCVRVWGLRRGSGCSGAEWSGRANNSRQEEVMGKGMQVTPGQIMAVKGTKGCYSAILLQCNAASTQDNGQAPTYKHTNKDICTRAEMQTPCLLKSIRMSCACYIITSVNHENAYFCLIIPCSNIITLVNPGSMNLHRHSVQWVKGYSQRD